jgi:hypothetical protein
VRHDGDAEMRGDGVELLSFASIRQWLFERHDSCVLGPHAGRVDLNSAPNDYGARHEVRRAGRRHERARVVTRVNTARASLRRYDGRIMVTRAARRAQLGSRPSHPAVERPQHSLGESPLPKTDDGIHQIRRFSV